MLKNVRVGWLYANPQDLPILREIGVYGQMTYTGIDWTTVSKDHHKPFEITLALGKNGILETCLCNEENYKGLQDFYEELWRTKYPYYNYSDAEKEYPYWSKITLYKAKQYMTEEEIIRIAIIPDVIKTVSKWKFWK